MIGIRWLTIFLMGTALMWSLAIQDVRAELKVLPGTSLEINGHLISDHTAVVEHPTFKEMLAAFARAEDAVQRRDIDALMAFYATAYNYHGLKKSDVRRVWGEVFTHYRQISSTHVFTKLRVSATGSQTRAEMTCTGGLYGAPKEGGGRVTLDSWFREVHYLARENGAWRFLGNAGNAPRAAPFTSAPHHPLF